MTAFDGNVKNVPRNIFIMLISIGIFAIFVLVSLSFTMANTVDQIAQEKSKRIIAATFDGSIYNFTSLTQDHSDWNAAYEWITARDDDAVFLNIGSSATSEVGFFDNMIIYDANYTPIYSFASEGNDADISHVIDEVAEKYLTVAYPTPVDGAVVYSGIERIKDSLVAVFASKVWPDPIGDIDINTLPVMITLVWLDTDFTQELADKTLMESLTISFQVNDASNSLPLVNLEGEKIASFQWENVTPSKELLTRTAGFIIALSVFFVLMTLLVGKVSQQQTQAYMQAHIQARTDPLTGLLNRTGITETINGKQIKADMNAGRMAVLYMDIDKFKDINDRYGHDAGDAALCKIADRLQFAVRGSDHVARLGGDEFIVIILDDAPRETAVNACERLINDAETELYVDEETTLQLHLSIGIAISRKDIDWRALVMQADAAMYEAKKSGTGYKFADSSFDSNTAQRKTSDT